MSSHLAASFFCSDVGFAWPDGEVVFDGLDLVVGPVRAGLVGRNGSGKSTLLRLVAGRLKPQRGSAGHTGELGYLPQDLALDTARRVDEALGIHRVRRAISGIERGHDVEANLEIVGDSWDVEEQAVALLARLGLGDVGLERHVGELSGGETVLLGLAIELLHRPDVLLLDEPTNNLDRRARHRLYDAVDSFAGALLVVSHDRELLDRMDRVGDLRDGVVTWYGGGFSHYQEALAQEQQAAVRAVHAAESDVRRQRRDLVEARTKLDRRQRYGQKMWDNKREPKVIMGERKRQAQVAAGKHRNLHLDRLEDAREALEQAESRVHDDADIRVDLPATELPNGRTALRLRTMTLRTGQLCDLEVRGPERVAFIGDNGAGKSTLLHTIAGDIAADGNVEVPVPWRLLPQRLDVLDDAASVVDNVRRFAPHADVNTVRARLARFLFRGTAADQPVGTLSGGERFRAVLAAQLLAEPAPQLLMLDEPTNNLDLATVAQLTSALTNYRGALLVAGHDLAFLRDIAITRWIHLAADELVEVDPPG